MKRGCVSELQINSEVTSTIVDRDPENTLEHLSNAVEQTADHIVITDKSGRIEYVNPAFVRISGYTREEACGDTPRLLKSGEQDPLTYKAMWEAARPWSHLQP